MQIMEIDSRKVENSDSELDIVSHWDKRILETALQRGIELRDQKTRPTDFRDYDVINIDFIKPPPLKSEASARRKGSSRRSCPRRKRALSPGSNIYKKSRNKRNKCPMRIVELSVPTKRQCLASWKMNAHILPDIMIDRLRQYVLDQRPIMEISDAINCFKYHKTAKKHKTLDKLKNTIKEQKSDNKKDNKKLKLDKRDSQNFCGIFGFKISQKLIKPMNIVLSSEVENIAKVVFDEITALMLKDKCNSREYLYRNRNIQREIASKIALWFKFILDETYYKMLEDQLKDLEEEAGPALDLMDEFVDNVLEVCVPQVDNIFSETSLESTSPQPKTPKEESSKDDMYWDNVVPITLESIDVTDPQVLEESDSIFVRSILNNIIDNAVPDESPEVRSDSLDADFISNDINDDYTVKNLDPIPTDDVNEAEDDFLFDDARNNVSDFSEDLSDGNDKKVKFAHSDMVTEEEMLNAKDSHSNENKIVSLEISKPNLVFAEPNDNLLSDADESWPGDIDPHELRPSESVSKSITSLGKIFEVDEKSISDYKAFMSNSEVDTTLGIEKERLETMEEKIESKYDFDYDISKNSSIDPTDSKTKNKKQSDAKNSNERRKNKSKRSSLVDASTITSYTMDIILEEKGVQMPSNQNTLLTEEQKKYLKDVSVNTSKYKGASGSLYSRSSGKIYKMYDQKDRKETNEIKIYPLQSSSYKLTASKTPSWAKSSNEELNKQRKMKLDTLQIRKWCTDLENAYNNMELWNKWIESALWNINYMKHASADNRQIPKCIKSNQWIYFKKDVNDDAILWINMHQNSKRLLSSYRPLYRKNIKDASKNRCKCHVVI